MKSVNQLPQVYDKRYKCPICSNITVSKKVFTERIKIKSYDEDMKPNYEGVNPLLYSVVVCSRCFYAALEQDFEHQVSPIYMDEVRKVQNEIKIPEGISFSQERDHKTAIFAYALATLFYNAKKQPCRVAEMYLRMAWLYREISDKDNELKALARALVYFEECYTKTNLDTEKEPMVLFYLGEISYKLGKIEDATKWFSTLVTNYRNVNSFYVKAGRDRWQSIRGEIK
jgi:uncharacterized protein (DUF2225 family)